MKITLPPKRWQSSGDTKYDSIRYHRWFQRLGKRKVNIALLQEASRQWPVAEHEGFTLAVHCANWCVSEREFRDYHKFVNNEPKTISKQAQDAINHAYDHYCQDKAAHAFHVHLEACAPLFAMNPRHLRELWEVCPGFYPTGYRQ